MQYDTIEGKCVSCLLQKLRHLIYNVYTRYSQGWSWLKYALFYPRVESSLQPNECMHMCKDLEHVQEKLDMVLLQPYLEIQ